MCHFYVYILQNPNGRFYVGHTDDLQRRLSEHNAVTREKSKYTRKNGRELSDSPLNSRPPVNRPVASGTSSEIEPWNVPSLAEDGPESPWKGKGIALELSISIVRLQRVTNTSLRRNSSDSSKME